MSWPVLINQLALLNFAVSALLHLRVYGRKGFVGIVKIASSLFLFATFLLLINVGQVFFVSPEPMVAGRWLFLAATLAFIGVALSWWIPVYVSSSFGSPIITVILLKSLADETAPGLPSSHLPYLEFHIAGASMGFLLAIVSAGLSALYLWQERLLKNRQISRLSRSAPALDIIDQALNACLWTGFWFLSAALVSGVFSSIWFLDIDRLRHYAPKVFLSVGVWLWYLVIIAARGRTRISGTSMAKMSLVGLIFLSIVFFGLSFSTRVYK